MRFTKLHALVLLMMMVLIQPRMVNIAAADEPARTDILVVGATPCGISAAIAASRSGSKVTMVEVKDHLGGMMSNGLDRTDIGPKNTAGGIFNEFIRNVRYYYIQTYGIGSQQVMDSNGGLYFEPWIDGSPGDSWTCRVGKRMTADGIDKPVIRAKFCELLYARFRSKTPPKI